MKNITLLMCLAELIRIEYDNFLFNGIVDVLNKHYKNNAIQGDVFLLCLSELLQNELDKEFYNIVQIEKREHAFNKLNSKRYKLANVIAYTKEELNTTSINGNYTNVIDTKDNTKLFTNMYQNEFGSIAFTFGKASHFPRIDTKSNHKEFFDNINSTKKAFNRIAQHINEYLKEGTFKQKTNIILLKSNTNNVHYVCTMQDSIKRQESLLKNASNAYAIAIGKAQQKAKHAYKMGYMSKSDYLMHHKEFDTLQYKYDCKDIKLDTGLQELSFHELVAYHKSKGASNSIARHYALLDRIQAKKELLKREAENNLKALINAYEFEMKTHIYDDELLKEKAKLCKGNSYNKFNDVQARYALAKELRKSVSKTKSTGYASQQITDIELLGKANKEHCYLQSKKVQEQNKKSLLLLVKEHKGSIYINSQKIVCNSFAQAKNILDSLISNDKKRLKKIIIGEYEYTKSQIYV